jgi:hypothetical protein
MPSLLAARDAEAHGAAHASDSTSACSSTTCVVFSCLSGGTEPDEQQQSALENELI